MLNSECGKIGGLSPIFRKKHTFFKVPCITLREDTEWVETVEDRWNVLVGANGFEPEGRALEQVRDYLTAEPCSLDLALAEVSNAIWKHQVIYRKISSSEATLLFEPLQKLGADVLILKSFVGYLRDATEIAVKEKLTIYDALYIVQAVYISTDYVFDGVKGTPYEEDDVPNPVNVYGLSKYVGEIFTRNYSQRYYIIRTASLYGKAGASGKGGNFVEFMIQQARNGERIKVVDDQFMSPTSTKDVAEMLKEFLGIKPVFGAYHMVNEGYCSWFEFTKEIFNILNWDMHITPIKSDELKRLARRPIFSALKNKKLGNLGLRMRDWEDALEDYLNEEKRDR